MALSGLWHAVRPEITRLAAGLSLGWPGRQKLIKAALAQQLPDFPAAGFGEEVHLWAGASPGRGWISFSEPMLRERKLFGWRRGIHFVDHHLKYRGRLRLIRSGTRAPPGDMDGDGNWEVILAPSWTSVGRLPPPRPEGGLGPNRPRAHTVIRLGQEHNEIVWAGSAYEVLPGPPGTRIVPIRRDEDGDGIDELVFVTKRARTWPLLGFEPPKTLAVFEWDRPGGILRARYVAPGSGLISWVPPESLPLTVAPNRPIDRVILDFMMNPERLFRADNWLK